MKIGCQVHLNSLYAPEIARMSCHGRLRAKFWRLEVEALQLLRLVPLREKEAGNDGAGLALVAAPSALIFALDAVSDLLVRQEKFFILHCLCS